MRRDAVRCDAMWIGPTSSHAQVGSKLTLFFTQFKAQEPGTDDEVLQFCQLNYGVTFPIAKKVRRIDHYSSVYPCTRVPVRPSARPLVHPSAIYASTQHPSTHPPSTPLPIHPATPLPPPPPPHPAPPPPPPLYPSTPLPLYPSTPPSPPPLQPSLHSSSLGRIRHADPFQADVNGGDTQPLWKYLKEHSDPPVQDIDWVSVRPQITKSR